MKISKREAGIIAVVIIALSGTSFVFAGNKDTQNNGVPFNEIWDAINGLQANVVTFDYLESRLAEIWEFILGLQANMENLVTFDHLEDRLDEIELLPGPEGPKGDTGDTGATGPRGPPGFLGTPDYDSGFKLIAAGQGLILTHNLGTQDIFVYVTGCDYKTENVHQRYLGGHIDYIGLDQISVGLNYWWVGNNDIRLHRYPDDNQDKGFDWDYYRVMIWKIPN